jgi:hypothetical protein
MEYLPGLAEVVAGDKQLQHRDVFLTKVKGRLLQAQQLMKHHCDSKHRDLVLHVGDWAWLKLNNRYAVNITDKRKLIMCTWRTYLVHMRFSCRYHAHELIKFIRNLKKFTYVLLIILHIYV